MRNTVRWLAMLLSIVMLCTSMDETAFALGTGLSDMDSVNVDVVQEELETEEITEDTTEIITEDTTEIITQEKNDGLPEEPIDLSISYVMVGDENISSTQQQYVLVGVVGGTEGIQSAVLHYYNRSLGVDYYSKVTELTKDALLFDLEFSQADSGEYELCGIDGKLGDDDFAIDFAELGISAVFGVDEQVQALPHGYVVEEDENAAQVVMTDDQGQIIGEQDIAQALENAALGIPEGEAQVAALGADDLVIVLDPGHGGADGGATSNNVLEKTANLAIALACKEELEQYTGVQVYLTREKDEYLTLEQRVNYAKSVEADVFISLHNNASTNVSIKGANVYYPNGNYKPSVGEEGQGLATEIQNALVALGLANGGIHIRNSESGTLYPDGGLADYYGVIRLAKMAGIPGIIVEHAFVTNAEDAQNYLTTEEQLTALGVADAEGIASYYGLAKGDGIRVAKLSTVFSSSSTEISLKWKRISGVDGYQIYRSGKQGSGYKKIATVTGSSTVEYTDKDLVTGNIYYYKVRGYKGSVKGGFSPVLSAQTLPMSKLKSAVSSGSGKISISWKAVEGVTGYRIYRATSKDGTYTLVDEFPQETTTYLDSGRKTTKTYYYKVQTFLAQNGTMGVSSMSSAYSGKTIAKTTIRGIESREDGGLEITWKSIENAYRYQVYRSTGKNGEYSKIASVTTNSYKDQNVEPGKKYYYKIRTLNRLHKVIGKGSYSSVQSGMQIPAVSIDCISVEKSDTLKISWESSAFASGYRIYRSTKKTKGYQLLTEIKGNKKNSYLDSGVSIGQVYYYKVQAVISSGKNTGVSGLSAARKAQSVASPEITYIQTVDSGSLKICWEPINGASGYKVVRSTRKKSGYQLVAEMTSGKTTTYTDTGLTTGKTYYYKVVAGAKNTGQISWGAYSEAVSARTADDVKLTEVCAVGDQALQLTWKKAKGADGYVIYRSTKAKRGYKKIATVNDGTQTTYKDVPAKTNTTYYYKVRAYNKNGDKRGYTKYSSVLSGKSLGIPTLYPVVQNKNSSLNIRWSKVTGATKYRVYRRQNKTGSFKKIAELKSSVRTYEDAAVRSGVTYEYKVIAYRTDGSVTGTGGFSTVQTYYIAFYEIMGVTSVTQEQMVAYYQAGIEARNTAAGSNIYGYPASVYTDKGAADIETFAKIVCEEAEAEGVKGEVVFAQILHETGYLQFGGDVNVSQCNFAGIGAVGGGVAGATFADVRTGIRAQVQHLKAYASYEALALPCVDPRFSLVNRGGSVYVEWLGIQENPNGTGWAADKNYGYMLMDKVNGMKSI